MKKIFYLSLLLNVVSAASAFANDFDQVAHRKALAVVLAHLKNPHTDLGKANARLLTPPADGAKPPATMSSGDMGGNQTITLSEMESRSEIDSTVLVRIAYSTGGDPIVNDSITVKIRVSLITNPDTGDIIDSKSTASMVPGSVQINSEVN